MDEQLNIALADILKASKDGIVNIALFAQSQAPELAKEVIQWGIWSNIFWIAFCPVVFFLSYKALKLAKKVEEEDSYSMYIPALNVMAYAASLFFIVVLCCSFQEFIKCLVAPKLYLIEYVGQLMRIK